jgi:hypothetical protein
MTCRPTACEPSLSPLSDFLRLMETWRHEPFAILSYRVNAQESRTVAGKCREIRTVLSCSRPASCLPDRPYGSLSPRCYLSLYENSDSILGYT